MEEDISSLKTKLSDLEKYLFWMEKKLGLAQGEPGGSWFDALTRLCIIATLGAITACVVYVVARGVIAVIFFLFLYK